MHIFLLQLLAAVITSAGGKPINISKKSNYNKTKASYLLGINRTTLWKKLKECNIECKSTIIQNKNLV
ncbi:helix-turn-helix domain-containing protein [uncultured Clostridium sp.]|uniref:helix-turn-helix domain-containing protein n=1 Tax=uncultured Clostridium sp. TaxID=59620 RepID=UPI0037DD58AB